MGENSWFSLIFYGNWNTKINEVCKLEDKISLYRQNFELRKENVELKREVKRLSYTLSKANDRIKYLENKLENIND